MKASLLAFVVLFLAGCATDQPCGVRQCSADERTVEAVRNNIRQHPALLADNLRVRMTEGTIYLYGLVSTYVEFVEIETIARATPGVTKVVNMTVIDNVQR